MFSESCISRELQCGRVLFGAEKIQNLLRRKLQLISTPKYLEKLRLAAPNYAETTTIYEKVSDLEHICGIVAVFYAK